MSVPRCPKSPQKAEYHAFYNVFPKGVLEERRLQVCQHCGLFRVALKAISDYRSVFRDKNNPEWAYFKPMGLE